MDQLNRAMSAITITVCKIIRKITSKVDFRYEADVTKRANKACLVPKIYFSH